KTKNIWLYQQGNINYLLNAEPDSQAQKFMELHNGAGANAMAFRVKDAQKAYARALEKGAKPATGGALDLPAIEGIGGSILYLVDTYGDKGNIYTAAFDFTDGQKPHKGAGLTYIDHLTHNV